MSVERDHFKHEINSILCFYRNIISLSHMTWVIFQWVVVEVGGDVGCFNGDIIMMIWCCILFYGVV